MKRKNDKGIIKEELVSKKAKKSVSLNGNTEGKPDLQPLLVKNGNNTKVVKNNFEKSSVAKKFDKSKKVFQRKGKKPNATVEKPNWQEFKKEKKELKEKRKNKKLSTGYDVSVKAKQISEKLRRANCSAEERHELTTQLYTLFQDNFKKFVLTHDMSRVIQWLIKCGSPEIRKSIVDEIKPSLLMMFQSKYGVNCIKNALKYGTPEIHETIISACYGNVVKLISHTIASPIIDMAYKTWATEVQKNRFKQEFYGDMYKHSKNDEIKTITDVFEKVPDMKSATLSAVKINLLRILNKSLVNSALVHSVLAEFLSVCTIEDRTELIVMLRNFIFELSKSKDGTKVAMICIWHGTTKDRKLSMKAMKDHIKDICISEHGHLILMAMFDSIDDTVLMKKILLPELLNNIEDIVASEYGKKVILYLVARRSKQHFHPDLIAHLEEGDTNAVSKKPAANRESELLQAVVDPILEVIAKNPATWMANSSIAMVTLAVLKANCEKKKLTDAFNAIAAFLTDPQSALKEGNSQVKAIEHPGLHMMLKKLIIADKVLIEQNKGTFGEALCGKLDTSIIESWSEFNRACFLLVLLTENGSEATLNSLMPKLKAATKSLKNKKHRGASLLLMKIE